MPRVPRHALTWSPAGGSYALAADGQRADRLVPGDEATWQGWLATADAFAFHGARGSLNVYREARPRGGQYWYAYHTGEGRTRKRYLGATARVTLARLEEVAAALAAAPEAVILEATGPVPDMAAVLPATKLAPPQPPAAPVARGRLLAALDASLVTPLTLVAAPAGWGKTTLLAAWARRHPRRVAWLALDAADDTPARFWAAAIAALRAATPGVGATALALLRAPRPPPPAVVVTALLNELAGPGAGDAPLVLLLDDYQAVADGAVRESVAFLLDHLPAGLRLVIAGRADPDLPLARLRARGQLAELRAADLGFTAAETGAFLGGALAAPLAGEAVAALAARTEGWAAGVQLAALALRGRADPAAWLAGFTGGHRFLLDYVEEEVLARQPPAIRDFLLRAAVLTRLGADVCAAVTGNPDSGAILAALERANLFIAPLDAGRRWYRLHDLFREALLARGTREPGLVREAHRRAAHWHADHGDGRAAIAHALAGEDYPLFAALIAREAPQLWLGGEAGVVLGWLLDLPDDLLLRRARLALDAALRLLGAGGESAHAAAPQAIVRLLDRLEGMRATPGGGASGPAGEPALLRRRTRLLRALLAARPLLLRGDAAGVAPLAAEIEGLAGGDEARWQLPGLGYRIWLVRDVRYESAPLLARLLALKRRALREGDRLATLEAMDCLAHEYTHLGRAALIERECLAALDLARRLGAQTIIVGALRFYLGYVYFGRDRLDESDSALRAALDVARIWQHAPLLVWGHQALARNALARADPAAADRALREAEALVGRPGLASFAPPVAAMRARYWLATGEHDRAADWAARSCSPRRPRPPWARRSRSRGRAWPSRAGSTPGRWRRWTARAHSSTIRATSRPRSRTWRCASWHSTTPATARRRARSPCASSP